MEAIELKYKNLMRLYTTLGKDIEAHSSIKKHHTIDEYVYDRSMASLVKHFELFYDLLWKYIREYLNLKHGIIHNSPRSVFHESLKQKICSLDETNTLLAMIESRNMSTHVYDTDIAQEVSTAIPKYYTVLSSLLPRIAPQTIR